MSAFFNCNQATLLIEKRAEQQLTLFERLSLWFHLLMCGLCRRYARQSQAVARLAQQLGRSHDPAVRLSTEARARLAQMLSSAGYDQAPPK